MWHPECRIASVSDGSGLYTLTVPYPDAWFIWAEDNFGFTDPTGGYVGFSDDEALDEAGFALAARLLLNKILLDEVLKTVYQAQHVHQIVYGIADNINGFPSILVTNPKRRSERVAAPFTWRHDYSFTIAFLIYHAEEQTELPSAVKFAERAARILNQSDYVRLPVNNGMILYDCAAKTGDYERHRHQGRRLLCDGHVGLDRLRIDAGSAVREKLRWRH